MSFLYRSNHSTSRLSLYQYSSRDKITKDYIIFFLYFVLSFTLNTKSSLKNVPDARIDRVAS